MGIIRLLLASAIVLSASNALARADIEVSFATPASADVYQTARYEATVANIGNRNASNVMLYIQLPETATSPTVHIMGTLGAFDSKCSILNDTILECDLGRVKKHKSKTIFFDLAVPAVTGSIDFIAEARTTSRESSTANNAVSATFVPDYIDTPISAPVLATNRHCTGQGLTAFFECALYPSSISSHQITLNAGGSITFTNPAAPTMSGQWTQPNDQLLYLVYRDANNAVVAAFRGVGVGGNCFEGLTVFPGSQWVSPYEVCL